MLPSRWDFCSYGDYGDLGAPCSVINDRPNWNASLDGVCCCRSGEKELWFGSDGDDDDVDDEPHLVIQDLSTDRPLFLHLTRSTGSPRRQPSRSTARGSGEVNILKLIHHALPHHVFLLSSSFS